MKQIQNYRLHQQMSDIIEDNSALLMTISRFGIAFGFGDNTVEEVCRANRVDANTFLAVCNLISGREYRSYPVSLTSLMTYLSRAHSYFLHTALPGIRRKLIESINYTGSDFKDVAFMLIKFYDDYVQEVERHMEYENETVFRGVARMIEGELPDDFSISEFTLNHGHMAEKLNELKDLLIYHYNQQDDGALSAALYDIIRCGEDLITHFEVEKKIFAPAVMVLEKRLRTAVAEQRDEGPDSDRMACEDCLSERERDIVIGVAKGLVNKEIADRLCLSVHTVKTHRRNISSKLGIHSPAGLTIYAILHNLVEIEELGRS